MLLPIYIYYNGSNDNKYHLIYCPLCVFFFSIEYQFFGVSKNNSVARKTGLTAPNLLGIMNFILEVLLITVIGKPYSSIVGNE